MVRASLTEVLRTHERARVEEIKRKITDGDYRPDAREIAEAILDDPAARRALSILPPPPNSSSGNLLS